MLVLTSKEIGDGDGCEWTWHVFCVWGEEKGEEDGKHIKPRQGVFYMFKEKSMMTQSGSGKHIKHICLDVFYVFGG